MDQLIDLADSGIAEHYVSVMPDVHLGKGATVGTVFASSNYVCPNAVGVDIGCGMCAIPLDSLSASKGSKVLSASQKDEIFKLIKDEIPTGFNHYSSPQPLAKSLLEEITESQNPTAYIKSSLSSKVSCQLGTLGGGNHFLEVLADESDRIWLMLHSGSRHIGKTTAEYYNQLAITQMQKLGNSRQGGDLNYMKIDSEEGQAYLSDMLWCQAYALNNRKLMMGKMIDIVRRVTGVTPKEGVEAINIHHNYCKCESCKVYNPSKPGEYETKPMWITRKGATSAKLGEYGIIPGSMGVGSYIVKGLGNAQSWESCSHGAGRKLSRIKAKNLIKQKDFVSAMDGIVCDTDGRLRDEAPQAYKDLNEVMANQGELVEIVHRLRPLINVKGFK
ncbi:hypothetical protein FGO68_gene13757 [Halteria grandinella]|uniref:3'-phosphate/5'-hydroxy nucleic acid ligase n=1 Tax=Halteria grandinella TaxID=5974 RepID=A0A8J8T1U9_HALGN|nr:hypothetical protein FGO68_gene13757 [Halteria grandinella]